MFNRTVFASLVSAVVALTTVAALAYTVPANNRVKFNMDVGWKVYQGDPANAQTTAYNDAGAGWVTRSVPYAWNENDAFAVIGSHVTTGIAWYRKHFTIPAIYAGRKVFVEFEEIRQAGTVYINGNQVGMSENGVTASGFDLTQYVTIDGTTDNVLAVRIDNSYGYVEASTGTAFQWCTGSYTTNFGGITQNVYLHITDKLYQTLPLFVNLQTQGTYIWGSNYTVTDINAPTGNATITAQSQVKNESGASETAAFSAVIVDMNGNVVSTLTGNTAAVANGATAMFTATGTVAGLNLWSIGHGYLYDVYTILTVNGVVTDVVKTKTGFRKLVQGNGNIVLNDRIFHLKGWAWRAQNPWPAIGDAFPAWMADFQHYQMLDLHSNFVRPMHVVALRSGIESADRIGIGYDMPAGDAEGDVTGVQWEQRKQVMRTSMIYSRNNPSIFMWEAGNADITEAQMQEMIDTATKWDPNGGRTMGCRGMLGTTTAQWAGEMLYVNKSRTRPRWETEYSRNESPRRWWDQWSPPEYHVNDVGTASLAGYNMNQDKYIEEEVHRYWEYWTERPGYATGTGTRVNAGGVKIEMADGTTFARSQEAYRRSGVVDAMRLPKDSYGAFKVMWDGWIEVDNKDVFITGHWTYPAGTTIDSLWVVSNCDSVELFVNNVSRGMRGPTWKFLFTWLNVPWATGTIRAVGYNKAHVQIAQDQISTAGAAAALRLTTHVSPAGLQATGADYALVDCEVVDANGNRCPTAENTITYAVTGQGVYRGGLSGVANGGNNYVLAASFPTECGISRISVRTTTTAGAITVNATAGGLTGATANLTSAAYPVTGGLTAAMPGDGLPSSMAALPPYVLANPQEVTIMPTGGTANTYDDFQNTSTSAATFTYNIANQAVNSVHIYFTDHGANHTFTVSVGGTQVWSGTTQGGQGYQDVTFTPTTGNTVVIAGTGGNLAIAEAEIYGPGTVGTKPVLLQAKEAFYVDIKKAPGRITVTVPRGEYTISMVDLFGRQVAKNEGDRHTSNVAVFSIGKLARGAYIIDVRGESQVIQKKFMLVQ